MLQKKDIVNIINASNDWRLKGRASYFRKVDIHFLNADTYSSLCRYYLSKLVIKDHIF
jgi:hypothetical protein